MSLKIRSRNGYTLIELLVVIGIIALITTTAIPFTINVVRAATTRSDTYRLITKIRHLQDQAIRTQQTIKIDPAVEKNAISNSLRFNLSDNTVVDVIEPLAFYADGTTSGGSLHLSSGSNTIKISVAWLTGAITTEQVQ
jgi:general secretion pathway protein H